MTAKLDFDPVQAVLEIFNANFPAVDVTVCWADDFTRNEPGWGVCIFNSDGTRTVKIDPVLPFVSLVHTLAHELAHAAAGEKAGHGRKFSDIFGRLYAQYLEVIAGRKELVEEANP